MVAKAPSFALLDKILHYVDIKQHQGKQAVVPMHLHLFRSPVVSHYIKNMVVGIDVHRHNGIL